MHIACKYIGAGNVHEYRQQNGGDIQAQLAVAVVRVHQIADVFEYGVVLLVRHHRPMTCVFHKGVHEGAHPAVLERYEVLVVFGVAVFAQDLAHAQPPIIARV